MLIVLGLNQLTDEAANTISRAILYGFMVLAGCFGLICLRCTSKLSNTQLNVFTYNAIKAMSALVVVLAIASICRYYISFEAPLDYLIGLFAYICITYLVYLAITFFTYALMQPNIDQSTNSSVID